MKPEESVKKSGKHMKSEKPAAKKKLTPAADRSTPKKGSSTQILQNPEVKSKEEKPVKKDIGKSQAELVKKLENELKEKASQLKREKELINKKEEELKQKKEKELLNKTKPEEPQYIVQKRGRGRPKKTL
ncbi:MAG: hypothetical protein FWC53_03380 [Firmicutes bacterium]|nr:hypothetical protein [Bacillota bacterium]